MQNQGLNYNTMQQPQLNSHTGHTIRINLPDLRQEVSYNTVQVDYLSSDKLFVVAHFILECGLKLEANSITICTAASLFHKFFSTAKVSDYDPYLIAGTCLYLGGKVEDNHLKLRDVINVVHSVLHKTLEPLPLGDQYWNTRDAIVQAELLVLRMCQFVVRFSHPHKYLLHYLKSLKDWMSEEVWRKYPVARTSWSMLQDLYHDPAVLSAHPSLTAIACIQLALETFGIQVPFVASETWYQVLDEKVTKEKMWEVMTRIMDVYNKEAEILSSLSKSY